MTYPKDCQVPKRYLNGGYLTRKIGPMKNVDVIQMEITEGIRNQKKKELDADILKIVRSIYTFLIEI